MFKLTQVFKEKLERLTANFRPDQVLVVADGRVLDTMSRCNTCSGGCGSTCYGSCSGSCHGNCSGSCSHYAR